MKARNIAIAALAVSLLSVSAASAETSKPAFAKWEAETVNVYLDPSVKASGWSLGQSIRAWSVGPVRLRVVSNPSAAQITMTEIPRSSQFNGNAEYVHVDGVMQSCAITLADNTYPRKRAHVAAHELGHCLGLPHVQDFHSVMDVWLRGDYKAPTSIDLEWVDRAYLGA